MLLRILLFASCFILINGVYVCPNSPQNLTSTIVSNDDSLPPNMNCNFTFTFNNPSTFALVNVSGWSIGPQDRVQVIGTFDTIASNNNSWLAFYNKAFPSSQVIINVQTGNVTNAVMSYGLVPMSVALTYQNDDDKNLRVSGRNGVWSNVGYVRLDVTQNNTKPGSAWSISADSTVSVIASSAPDNDFLNFLNVFVLDQNLNPIGSLYSMYNTPFNSTNANVTLFYASAFDSGFKGTILLNDLKNLASCATYRTQWSYGNPAYPLHTPGFDTLYIDTVIDATNGSACLTILNEVGDAGQSSNWPIIQNILTEEPNGPYSANTTFVAGTPMDDTTGFVLGTMGIFDSFSLPQFFDGSVRTIILDGGKLELQTTTNYSAVSSIEAAWGRNAFVATNNFPNLKALQTTSNDLFLKRKDNAMFSFSFRVNFTDVDQFSEEQIQVESYDPAGNYTIYLGKASGQTFSCNTRSVSLRIQTGSQWSPNMGTYLTYWISTPANTTTTNTTSTVTPTTTSTSSSSSTTTTPIPTNGVNATVPTTNATLPVTSTITSTSTASTTITAGVQTTEMVASTDVVSIMTTTVESITQVATASSVLATFITWTAFFVL